MVYYAVIDTNVFIAALLSKKEDSATVQVLEAVKQYGIEVFPQPTGKILVDMDDLVFYEVAMEKREEDAYLVTGNTKHYLNKRFIVTPAEMLDIISGYQ